MNLFRLPGLPLDEEECIPLWEGDGVRVERIVSAGQASPPGFWYDQQETEWLVLLQGRAAVGFEDETVELEAGDTLLIPPHRRHRVERTSAQPPCLWLCVFGRQKEERAE